MQLITVLNLFGVLFLVHLIVYFFIAGTFNIQKRVTRVGVYVLLFFLSLSFVFSTLLLRWKENFVTESLYFIFSFWIGMLINLLLVIAVVYFVIGVLRVFGKKLNRKIVGILTIIFVFLFSVFGVWNAYNYKITEIEIEIRDLPDEWKGKKIVQLSDVHLGGNLDEGFFEDIVASVNELEPEIVVITGDLFDGSVGVIDSYLEILDKIDASEGVYFVTGNHEGYSGVEEIIEKLKTTKVNVLEDEIVDINGLQLIGISYSSLNEPGPRNIKKIIQENENFNKEKPSILLYHSPTSIDGYGEENETNHSNMYLSPNIDFSGALELGIDLQLSGHTHGGQIFPFNFVTNYIYDGYDYGLHEIDGFFIYTSSGTGFWGPPMRTYSRSEIVLFTLK